MKPRSSPLPKPLEIEVARVARQLRKPARRVLAKAIEEYVARHDPAAVTEAMNRVADEIDNRPDPALASAARSVLEHTEW